MRVPIGLNALSHGHQIVGTTKIADVEPNTGPSCTAAAGRQSETLPADARFRDRRSRAYFIATVFSLVAVVAAMGFIFDQLAGVRNVELQKAMDEVKPQESRSELFKKESNNLKKAQNPVDAIGKLYDTERAAYDPTKMALFHDVVFSPGVE